MRAAIEGVQRAFEPYVPLVKIEESPLASDILQIDADIQTVMDELQVLRAKRDDLVQVSCLDQ